MKNIMKKLHILLVILALWVMSGSPFYTVMAQETTEVATDTDAQSDTADSVYDEKNGIALVRLVYDDGTEHGLTIKNGCAFFIGDKSKSVYLITNYNTVTLTDGEKAQLAESYAVDVNQIKTKIEVVLKADVIVEATLQNGSRDMDFAILSPASSLSGCTTLLLCEDASINENGAEVYTYNAAIQNDQISELGTISGVIEDWTEINGAHFYKYSAGSRASQGMPLLNANHEVIGMMTNTSGDNVYCYALQIDEIIEVLEVLGLEYNPAIEVDTAALEEIIAEFEALEQKKYTETSWQACVDAHAQAVTLLEQVEQGDLSYSTQDEINSVAEALRRGIDNLEKADLSVSTVILIAIAAGGVLLIVIIVLVVVLIVKARRYKRRLQEESGKNIAAEEALRLSGRITPGAVPNQTSSSMPLNRSLTGASANGFAEYAETSVLVEDIPEQSPVMPTGLNIITYPKLIRRKTGESVLINKDSFIIGSSAELSDYCIKYNNGISRKHICIMKMADGYYLQDLQSTNGTYVNGMFVNSERYVKLYHGSIIFMAEEEFEFQE